MQQHFNQLNSHLRFTHTLYNQKAVGHDYQNFARSETSFSHIRRGKILSNISVSAVSIATTPYSSNKGSTWVQIIMLCHTSLFIFSLCPHVTFYKTLMSLSTFFIKGHVGSLQLLNWPCRTSFFTHVVPYSTNSDLLIKQTTTKIG